MDSSEVTSDEAVDLLLSLPFRRTAADEDYAAAITARMYVDTAVGIVMGKHDCNREAALASLRRTASVFDITILELAEALTSRSGT